MRRSRFIASVAAAVAVPNIAVGQSLPKVRIGGTSSQDIIGALYGVQGHVFAKYGVDAEYLYVSGGSAILAAVIGGSLEIGKVGVFDIIRAYAKGIPVLIEAPGEIYHAENPDAALVVAKDSPYKRAADLNGKTFSSPGLRDFFTVANMAWMDANGGDSRSVKFVELAGPAQIAAIQAGRVDAASLAKPLLTDAVESGACRILGHSMSVFGKRFCATAYITTASYAQHNADVLARFRKGLDEASAYANAHESEMIPIIANTYKLDPQKVAQMPPSVVGLTAQLRDASMFQAVIDKAVTYQVIDSRFPYSAMIDPKALNG